MKRALVVGLLALLAACGDDDAIAPVICPDAGAVEAGPAVVEPIDAGPLTRDALAPDVAPPPARQTTLTLLRASASARFVGVTTGASPHVAYLELNDENTFDLSVLPVAGGSPAVLQKGLDLFSGDGVLLRGGVLAWYLGVNADNVAPAIHLWSAAAGAKTVTTPTQAGMFWATEDGARVAFSVNATLDTTDIAVTPMSAPSATVPALAGANAMNLVVSPLDCPARLDFRGATFIGAYCTGVLDTQVQPRLVTVGADGAAVVRLDNTVPANDFDGTWATDAAGAKIVVNDAVAGAHLVDASSIATTVVGTIAKVDALGIVPDGSAALYLVGGALKKATFADPPVVTDLLPSGVDRLFVMTKDSTTLLYAKTNAGGLNDLYALDLAAPGTPRALRASATNVYFGLTGTQTHAFVIDVADVDANRVYAVPIAGGPPVLLVDPVHPLGGGLDLEPSPASTGLVFTIDSSAVPGTALERSTLGYVDALKGGGLEPAATILRAQDERGDWSGNTYVFRDVGTKPGIYALTLP
ncbi:MAG: hypothetical protein U0270_34060 [Labilithrix sp.]